MKIAARAIVLAAAGLAACDGETEPITPPPAYDFGLPRGFAVPAVPADNPMTAEKVTLGRSLFFDTRLSGNGTMSCGTCHEPDLAYADAKIVPTGSTGELLPRNAPTLTNVAYLATFTWGNPTLTTLEEQAIVPMFGEVPVELGITGHEEEVLGRFRADPASVAAFEAAFPGDADAISFENMIKAIASYERTLIATGSPFDRYNMGDDTALSDAQKRGMDLFFSERFECYHCHSGTNFTTSFRSSETKLSELDFHNTGLYALDATGAYPAQNQGLYELTLEDRDRGKFRVPSLRNVALTAPYMHDGSIATLGEVIDHYAAGGRDVTEGPFAGDGRENPNKSPLVRAFPITAEEKADVIAFLESFTDVPPR